MGTRGCLSLLTINILQVFELKIDILEQGWVFAMAKTIFAGTVEKTVKTVAKTGKIKDTIN